MAESFIKTIANTMPYFSSLHRPHVCDVEELSWWMAFDVLMLLWASNMVLLVLQYLFFIDAHFAIAIPRFAAVLLSVCHHYHYHCRIAFRS